MEMKRTKFQSTMVLKKCFIISFLFRISSCQRSCFSYCIR